MMELPSQLWFSIFEYLSDSDMKHLWLRTAKFGNLKFMKLLIDYGIDVNCHWRRKPITALVIVCRFGHKDCVKLLLDAGANVNVGDCDGMTAIMWASRNYHLDIVKMLNEKSRGESRDEVFN